LAVLKELKELKGATFFNAIENKSISVSRPR
jgi:hypothetical protein